MTGLANRLHKVDPDLKVISGAAHRHGASQQDWMASTGITCSKCGKEVFRSVDGMCPSCYDSTHEFEIRDKAGALKLLPQSIISRIVHKARKDSE